MKYFLISFSDFSETIGKQTTKQKMLSDARRYCKMWNLSETVTEVKEITEDTYIQKGGKL